MKRVILLDLGGTLVEYFDIKDFPHILRQAIIGTHNLLIQKGLIDTQVKDIWPRVEKENHEAKNHRVRPLEKRLISIFRLPKSMYSKPIMREICRQFMKPIFARGQCYKDTIPTLEKLSERGFKTALVSNTTWGSPAYLWREEIKRLGLNQYLDTTVFCRDVGWRKPAKPIFRYTLNKMRVDPSHCIFIGDDPRWDIIGPKNIGIDAILINRKGVKYSAKYKVINSLEEILGLY